MVAREAGRVTEAIAFYRMPSAISASIGDWRLEAMARNNLVDLLWQVAPIEEAAREANALAEALRVKPAAHNDMDILFANLVGILSEMGRIDEASAVAREALPLMRRTQRYFVEEWVYLFWRRGQVEMCDALTWGNRRRGAEWPAGSAQ